MNWKCAHFYTNRYISTRPKALQNADDTGRATKFAALLDLRRHPVQNSPQNLSCTNALDPISKLSPNQFIESSLITACGKYAATTWTHLWKCGSHANYVISSYFSSDDVIIALCCVGSSYFGHMV